MIFEFQFQATQDYGALTGALRFSEPDHPKSFTEDSEPMVTFWMRYAWSAFCLQWVAISWAAIVGKDNP